MSYIQDDVQMIKSCIKYIDEDKIVDFLNSIEFEFDDFDADSYILQSSNSKFIELCIDSYLQYNSFNALFDTLDELIEDNKISNTAITIIKNKLLKQTNPDIIYKILNSNLVTWNDNPFISGSYNGEFGVSVSREKSILTEAEVNDLFWTYAVSEHWLYCTNAGYMFAKDKESLVEAIENDGDMLRYGYYDIQTFIDDIVDEEFVKDYFDGNIPDKVDANTAADIWIKCGMYKYL